MSTVSPLVGFPGLRDTLQDRVCGELPQGFISTCVTIYCEILIFQCWVAVPSRKWGLWMLIIYGWSPPHSSFPSAAAEVSLALCQRHTSPSPLCTIGFGESVSACIELALRAATYGAFWDGNWAHHPKCIRTAWFLPLTAYFSLQEQGERRHQEESGKQPAWVCGSPL